MVDLLERAVAVDAALAVAPVGHQLLAGEGSDHGDAAGRPEPDLHALIASLGIVLATRTDTGFDITKPIS
ncbi:hypothetical protein [Brachybacterium alimentarium]|uniref:hypothetical protein n=1 Tax=Brachybacterium alimentarium TaxID=47845 RepID=UPI0011C027D7|nr:hypothetical protein [Brachybacterium alimentarium]